MFSYDEMNPLTEKRQLLRVKSSTERIFCNKIPITVREKKEEKQVKSYKNDCKKIKQIIESITQSAQLKEEQIEMLLSVEKIVNNIIIEKEKETKNRCENLSESLGLLTGVVSSPVNNAINAMRNKEEEEPAPFSRNEQSISFSSDSSDSDKF